MGDLRSIRVFVLGEAEKPGSYTVSGLSTMTNALFVSGGVKKIGSLRNIELKRDGRLVSVLDLYDLLLHGDTSGDRKLLPGDVIFIPPIGNTVAVGGSVRRPAIYETKGEKTVAQAIALAGGLLPDADPKLVQMERIMPDRLRQMLNVDLTQPRSAATGLVNGDKVLVQQIRPTLENSVTLSGYVFRPGKFEYRAGLRLTDILGNFDELRPDADAHYIMIRRVVPPRGEDQKSYLRIYPRPSRRAVRRRIRNCGRAMRSWCSTSRPAAIASWNPSSGRSNCRRRPTNRNKS